MEQNQFKQLLQLKGIREKETLPLLEDFIEKFPYCQTSRLLLAKALHDQNNIHYDQNLKLAAAYAPNREVLRDLIEMKSEEVEFEFPLPKKESAVVPGEEIVYPDFKEEEQFEESYSEDEISGRAFEEQKEQEKLIDPHEVIRQRLSEILGGSQQSTVGSPQSENTVDGKELEEVNKKEEIIEEKIIVPEEIKVEHVTSPKVDAEETVYKEDIVAEQKLEEELIHPTPEKSEGEKIIIRESEKTQDSLDRMELEHAMEESILDSLEKLPIITPEKFEKKFEIPVERKPPTISSSREKISDTNSPRSFTEWLKTINTKSSSGFEEVHATKSKIEIQEEKFSSSLSSPISDDPDSHLSDDELIEKFLIEDPKIETSKAEFYSPVSQAKKSVMDHDDVVSETLAKIYLSQGNTQKARWCYEKLILLHPEKSAFFAALLKEIDQQTNSKQDL